MHIARSALTSLAAGLILGLVLFTFPSWASGATVGGSGIARDRRAALPFAFTKGVGLSAGKTSWVFDDVTVWDASVLPES